MESEESATPLDAVAPTFEQSPPSSVDLLRVDDRLVVLERSTRDHGGYLQSVQRSLSDQMITLAVLELTLALVFAMMLYTTLKADHRA